MINRLLQRIHTLFTIRSSNSAHQPTTNSRDVNHSHQAGNTSRPNGFPKPASHNCEYSHHAGNGSPGRHSQQPRFSGARLLNANQLLQEGRLQIGIAGFNDTAFEVAIVNRHNTPETRAAVADLPCRIKFVSERNIADGLLLAQRMMGKANGGRRSIIVITSGDSTAKRELLENVAESAAMKGIGVHVICLGPKQGDPTSGLRINTKETLGYGGFRVANNEIQLLTGLRDAVNGLLPARAMRGTNKAVILVDCSETMVEQFRSSTRIEVAMTSIQELLRHPLARARSLHRPNSSRDNRFPATTWSPRSDVPLTLPGFQSQQPLGARRAD